jgi:hypothetical protein
MESWEDGQEVRKSGRRGSPKDGKPESPRVGETEKAERRKDQKDGKENKSWKDGLGSFQNNFDNTVDKLNT